MPRFPRRDDRRCGNCDYLEADEGYQGKNGNHRGQIKGLMYNCLIDTASPGNVPLCYSIFKGEARKRVMYVTSGENCPTWEWASELVPDEGK